MNKDRIMRLAPLKAEFKIFKKKITPKNKKNQCSFKKVGPRLEMIAHA